VDVLLATSDGRAECALLRLLRTPECLTCDVFAVPRLYHLHLHPAPFDRIGPVPVMRVLPPNLSGLWRAIRRAVDATVCGLALAVLLPFAATSKRRRGVVVQLWNAVRGGVSLVGPRPDRPDHIAEVSARYECYRPRRRARAGLTGLAQISGLQGHVSAHDRARYDNYYIENWSLWLDIKIVITALSHLIGRR
jgi:lipopolysaccharide/colanic/teichoic acid biosynthesis glycosyltransferase